MSAPNQASASPSRRCARCGSPSLAHRRADARYCCAPCRAAASRARAARTPKTLTEALDQARREESARTRTEGPKEANAGRDEPDGRPGVEEFIAGVLAAFDAEEVTPDDIPGDAVVIRIDARAWPG